MKECYLNLDLPPKERWILIGKEFSIYGAELQKQVKIQAEQMLGSCAPKINYIFKKYYTVLNKLHLNPLITFWDELHGLASGLNVSIDTLIYLNYGYDFSTKCTTATTTIDQKLVHLRTLDWNFPFLKNLVCLIHFVRNGKIIYKSAHIIGLVGLVTAMNDHLSVSINYRHSNKSKLVNTCKSVWHSIKRHYPVTIYLRYVMDTVSSYDDTVNMLCNGSLLSPVYYVVCGIQSSSFIYRDRQDANIIQKCGDYTVQTNHDVHFGSKSCNITGSSLLRYSIMHLQLSKAKSINDAKNILSIYPINNSATIYSTIMIPITGILIITIPTY